MYLSYQMQIENELHQEIDYQWFLWNSAVKLHCLSTFNIFTFLTEMVRNLAANKDFTLA